MIKQICRGMLMLPTAITLCFFSAPRLQAASVDSLYSQSELETASHRSGPKLRGVWLEDLQGILTPQERQVAARSVLVLPFLSGQGHPLAFYSDVAARRVYVPISSFKFFDDLAITVTWLDKQGCDTQAAFDYVGMLRYQAANLPGSLPPPLKAFGVPSNVLDDPFVDDVSQKILKSAIYFIMAHELGHVFYQHQTYNHLTATDAQRQEREADAFALNVMRRIAVPPLGAVIFFSAVARYDFVRADFKQGEYYESYLQQYQTHPLSSDRLKTMAKYIRDNAVSFTRAQSNPAAWLPRVQQIAADLDRLAGLLSDPNMRNMHRNQGLTRRFDELRNTCRR